MPMGDDINPRLRIVICYSRVNANIRDRVRTVLGQLGLGIWADIDLAPGRPFFPDLDQKFRCAHLIIPLISHDFFDSEYITRFEMPHLLNGHVLPLVISEGIFRDHPVSGYTAVNLGQPLARATAAVKDRIFQDLLEQVTRFRDGFFGFPLLQTHDHLTGHGQPRARLRLSPGELKTLWQRFAAPPLDYLRLTAWQWLATYLAQACVEKGVFTACVDEVVPQTFAQSPTGYPTDLDAFLRLVLGGDVATPEERRRRVCAVVALLAARLEEQQRDAGCDAGAVRNLSQWPRVACRASVTV
jgi:hypothetical protein